MSKSLCNVLNIFFWAGQMPTPLVARLAQLITTNLDANVS